MPLLWIFFLVMINSVFADSSCSSACGLWDARDVLRGYVDPASANLYDGYGKVIGWLDETDPTKFDNGQGTIGTVDYRPGVCIGPVCGVEPLWLLKRNGVEIGTFDEASAYADANPNNRLVGTFRPSGCCTNFEARCAGLALIILSQ